jgi:hypothetical protein
MADAYTNDNGAWYAWMDGTSATSSNDTTWNWWTADSGTTAGDAWNNWMFLGSSSAASDVPTIQAEPRTLELTPDELERREQRRLEAEERSRERERKQAEANDKAEELLRSMLTQEQLGQLDAMAAFEVTTERAKYRIKRGRSGNVKELNVDGQVVASYCIHPRERVPDADTMLAQKLMLESDEAEFLRIANRTQYLRA